MQRLHRAHRGDEQRAAARSEDALQVRPEGVLVQAARLAQGALQELAHLQGPGLPGDARRPALRLGHLQRHDEDTTEGLPGESVSAKRQWTFSLSVQAGRQGYDCINSSNCLLIY